MPALTSIEVAFLMVACQQLMLGLGWLVAAASLRLDRRSLVHWSGYALLTALSLVLLVWATRAGNEHIRAIGNISVALGVLLMHRGVRLFIGSSVPRLAYAVLAVLVLVVSWLGLTPGYGPLRVVTISALIGGLNLASSWDIFGYARRRLQLRLGFWLGVPLLLGGLVFMLRALRALLSPETVLAEVSASSSLNVGTAVVWMVTALVFQLALVALVGARLITDLSRLSRYDSLTELLNRRAMEDALRREAQRAARAGTPFSVLMVDADHFKDINDRFGHAAGDEALRHLAEALRAERREVDAVGRFGGEEFIVLLPGTSPGEALKAAQRLRESLINRPWAWQEQALPLTVSTGVAAWNGNGDDVTQLLQRADSALYRAKELGRDRYELAA